MRRIAIIAALPGELKPLVRGWQSESAPSGIDRWVLRTADEEWSAVCAGMGKAAATRAFADAERDGRLDMVLSVGWAGALIEGLNAGQVYVPSIVIDAQTGERFALTDGERKFTLVSCARVADEAEKRRLAAEYGAVLVDMEAGAIARLAEMRGIPLVCFKAVSDGVNQRLPDMNPHIDASGKLKMMSFVSHVAVRPRYWSALVQLKKNSERGAEQIRDAVLKFMKEKNAGQG